MEKIKKEQFRLTGPPTTLLLLAAAFWEVRSSHQTDHQQSAMNQLCKVCGEPAAGFHFGAFTCEGCKSFFGRTYNNISAISGCKNNGDCVINKKNRTACKACRLRKCLLVGMSKSGSRYGRRSNWFKIHCLLQEQQSQQHQQHQNNSSQSPIQMNLDHLSQPYQIRSPTTYSPQHKITSQQQMQQHQKLKTVNDVQNPLVNSYFSVQNLFNGASRGVIHISDTRECDVKVSKTNNNDENSNIQKSHLKGNHRISETPSDSGASSADPEDSESCNNKDNNSSNIRRNDSPITDEKYGSNGNGGGDGGGGGGGGGSLTPNSDPIRSASEPLQGFPLFPTHEKFSAFLGFPPLHIPPVILSPNLTIAENVQEEPIDLSLKSTSTRCRITPPKTNGVDIPKPSALDLTLARSQPMSG